MLGILSLSEVDALLSSKFCGHLACCWDNKPYIVPVNFVFADGVIYGRTNEGLKVDMMRKNPQVCLEVEDINTLREWKTVIVSGRFEELTEPQERAKALEKLHEGSVKIGAGENFRFSAEWPFVPVDINAIEGIVYKIIPEEKNGRFEKG